MKEYGTNRMERKKRKKKGTIPDSVYSVFFRLFRTLSFSSLPAFYGSLRNRQETDVKILFALILFAAASIPVVLTVSAMQSRAPLPQIIRPVRFDTPEADRILAALQVFPPDNPWNQDISTLPTLSNSAAIIASIGKDKQIDFNLDMNFVVVPPDQPRVPVKITRYPNESDPGPYPVPDSMPIENWPLQRNEDAKALPKPGGTLDDIQRNGSGDRHGIVVDPVNGLLYEFYQARKTDAGWEAAQASIFDLKSNKLRPERWTSADAAGLPVFPAAVRFDECESGMVRHAMRFTVRRTRRAYVYPARHFASRLTDENLPRMGERLRLRQDFDITGFPPHAQAILKGLKKHGMFVADNGGDWRLSIAPDRRLKGLESLTRLKGSDFEVVDTESVKPGRTAPIK
jgi:hypothetical protein